MSACETPPRPLTDRIRAVIAEGDVALPPLPEFAARIVEVLNDDSDASAATIAGLIQNEPAIAATILRMANSAMFGGLRKINSLPQAVARLGTRQVFSAVTALVHKGNFHTEDADRKRLLSRQWTHAVTTGMSARRLAAVVAADGEEAFLAGLLHDIGKLLVLRAVDHLEAESRSLAVAPALLDELMHTLHAELGHDALRAWNLPEAICQAALHHHDPEPESEGSYAVLVKAANAIAHSLDASTPEAPEDLLEIDAIERLNLQEIELAEMLVDLEDQIEEIKQILV